MIDNDPADQTADCKADLIGADQKALSHDTVAGFDRLIGEVDRRHAKHRICQYLHGFREGYPGSVFRKGCSQDLDEEKDCRKAKQKERSDLFNESGKNIIGISSRIAAIPVIHPAKSAPSPN